MPAETMHDGAQPSARTEAPQLIVPDHVKGNIRGENQKFDNLGSRSSTYNTPGVNPEDPYNAFARSNEQEATPTSPETQEAVVEALTVDVDALQSKVTEYENRIAQLEAVLRDTRERADVQPRRVIHKNGVTYQEVKYTNGNHVTYELEEVDKAEYKQPLTAEVNEGWDDFEKERAEGKIPTAAEAEAAHAAAATEAEAEAQPPVPEQSATEAAEERAAKAAETEAATDASAESDAEAEAEATPEAEGEAAEQESNPEEEPKAFEIILEKEFEAQLEQARDNYARLSAKHRNSYIGHFLTNSRFLAKSTKLKEFADKQNAKHDAKELGPAREAYRSALKDLQEKIRELCIEEYGETEEAKKQSLFHSVDQISNHELAFETTLADARQELSGESNKFADWWVRQDTFLRRVGKFAVVAGVALPVGIVAGLGGAPLIAAAGIAAGGAIGAGMGAFATKKRASAETRQGGTLADVQKSADQKAKADYMDAQQASGQFADIDKLIDMTEERTGKEKTSNRMRVKGAGSAGIAGAGLGVSLGGAIRGGIDSLAQAPDNTEVGNADGDNLDAGKEAETNIPKPEYQGENFGVESGNGYTHELIDFAQANGHELSTDNSWELHKALVDQFGTNYIDVASQAQDTYNMGGGNYNVGITAPGEATWNPGVADFIKNWMAAKGLW